MPLSVDEVLPTLLDTSLVRSWLETLSAHFFDSTVRRQIAEEVRARLPELGIQFAESERNKLAEQVFQELCRQSSLTAVVPAVRPAAFTPLHGPELGQVILRTYPQPIAVAYEALNEAETPAVEFRCLLALYETLIHYLASVAVCAYLRTALDSPECNRHLLGILTRRKWTAGIIYSLLRDTLRLAGDLSSQLPYPELSSFLLDPRGKPTSSGAVLEAFLSLRNETCHGGNPTDAYCAPLVGPNRARLEEQLALMPWLGQAQLVRPVVLDGGSVVRADLLNGAARWKRQPCTLALVPDDREASTSDIRADRETLLLVGPAPSRYLPLTPLALYRVAGQGSYFLQGVELAGPDGPLRRANYLGYYCHPERHEELPRDLAAAALQRQLDRLHGRTPTVAPAPKAEVAAEATTDPDLTLPEVTTEQQSHLQGFIGRDDLLQKISDWIDRHPEGGYLLLLGPPGQGKSALMAALARREGQGGGCLLHMVKSHPQPLRFVPALISQAAKLTHTRFGPEAYRGDLDDLRNSLVRALEAVRAHSGRAVVVLDALDELEVSGGRIHFLPPQLPEGVRAVLTCRPDIPLVNALRARLHGQLEELTVEPLSLGDFRRLLERRLEVGVIRTLEQQVNLNELFQRMNGNPLFLCCFVDDLARRWQEGLTELDLQRVPTTLDAVFRDIYDRLRGRIPGQPLPVEGRQRARLLQLLCVGREPLSLEALAGLLTSWGETIFLDDCRDRLEEMSQWLLEPAPGHYKPWHQKLTDHVREAVLGPTGVRQVEELFCRWLEREEGSDYDLKYRIAHLLAAGRSAAAVRLLLDWRFLEARTEAGLVFDLAADFRRVVQALELAQPQRRLLELLEEALRRDLHFLARHPETLFQCLWNSCWWYDCPAAALHYDLRERHSQVPLPWDLSERPLSSFLEQWRAEKEQMSPGFVWLRALRPPAIHLGTAQKAVFEGHGDRVNCVDWSPDGRWLISGALNGTVRLWDAHAGNVVLERTAHEAGIWNVRFTPDGLRFVTASDDGTYRTWDAATGTELASFPAPGGGVAGLAIAPDGRHLALGSATGTIQLLELESGHRVQQFNGHQQRVTNLRFSPCGRCLASSSRDQTIRLWEVASGKQLLELRGVEHVALDVCFSPDQEHLLGVFANAHLFIWHARTGAEIHRWQSLNLVTIGCVRYSPDGQLIAAAGSSGLIQLWDASTFAEVATLGGHGNRVLEVTFSPDGQWLASASWDRSLCTWSVRGGTDQRLLKGHQEGLNTVAFSPDGNRLVTAADDHTVRVWDARTGLQLACLRGHTHWVRTACFSPDGRYLASGGWDRTVRLWDGESGAELHCFQLDDIGVQSLSYSQQGERLACGSFAGTVRVWEVATRQLILAQTHHQGPVRAVSFSPDGRWVVSGSEDCTLRVWDIALGKELACLPGQERAVLRVEFAGPHQIISTSLDDTRCIWDLDSGLCRMVLSSPTYQAVGTELETVIRRETRGPVVAWFPGRFWYLAAHPTDWLWAGGSSRHLLIFTLQGRPPNL